MFDNLFEGESVYYEYPSFEVAIFSLLLAFVLSSVIAFTYKYTYKGKTLPNHFFQAIILSSIVTSMIMMAVGNNLAVGFGIIGAVSIIRFRTIIRDTRNIIFMFAGLSIGIATGVYGYSIAIAGTIIYCVVAALLSYSSYGYAPEFDYDLIIDLPKENNSEKIEAFLVPLCLSLSLESRRKTKSGYQLSFIVRLKNIKTYNEVFDILDSMEQISKFSISKNYERKTL